MRRLSFVLIAMALLAGGSVSAQKRGLDRSPILPKHEVNIQSDEDGTFLIIDTLTGAYRFSYCENGTSMGGFGRVTIDGCSLNFKDIAFEYRVVASADLCTNHGKAAVEVYETFKTEFGEMQPMKAYMFDDNLGDNTTECGAKKK